VWLSFEGPTVNDVLIASGLHTLSAVQTYPDFRAWEILDPHERAVDLWNRYAQISFVPGSNNTPTLTLINPVAIQVAINPCSPTAGGLGIGFVVSPSPLANQCLSLKAHTTVAGGSVYPEAPVYVYARTATPTT
jgi:hypothetical protein